MVRGRLTSAAACAGDDRRAARREHRTPALAKPAVSARQALTMIPLPPMASRISTDVHRAASRATPQPYADGEAITGSLAFGVELAAAGCILATVGARPHSSPSAGC